jgi:hypothetical protein
MIKNGDEDGYENERARLKADALQVSKAYNASSLSGKPVSQPVNVNTGHIGESLEREIRAVYQASLQQDVSRCSECEVVSSLRH